MFLYHIYFDLFGDQNKNIYTIKFVPTIIMYILQYQHDYCNKRIEDWILLYRRFYKQNRTFDIGIIIYDTP